MKIYITILLGILLLAVIGCTPEQELKVRELIGQHRCATFNGYLCSAPDDCNLPYLDTIESYCCSIPCQTCNQSCDDGIETTEDFCSKVTNYTCQHKKICPKSCDDEDSCTEDYCSENTEYECKHKTLKPCPNNGICEQGEYLGLETSCEGTSTVIVQSFKSEDCPKTCNDGDANTADNYDFDKQKCINEICDSENESISDIDTCVPSEYEICESQEVPSLIEAEETEKIVPRCGNNICESGENI